MAAETSHHDTPASDASTAEAVARRYLREIVHERVFDAIEELFAHPENWETVSLVGGERVDSYAELRDYYRAALPAFESVTAESIVADGSTAMIRWTATGDVSDGFPGLPVTGTSFETTAMTELGIDEGQIVTLHVQVNEMDLLPEVS
ncbi:MAG: ester cyclase [Halobacteriales archaeon]